MGKETKQLAPYQTNVAGGRFVVLCEVAPFQNEVFAGQLFSVVARHVQFTVVADEAVDDFLGWV